MYKSLLFCFLVVSIIVSLLVFIDPIEPVLNRTEALKIDRQTKSFWVTDKNGIYIVTGTISKFEYGVFYTPLQAHKFIERLKHKVK